VAVAFLRRATEPRRRWDGEPIRSVRSGPSASSPAAGLGDRAGATGSVEGHASPSEAARRDRHQGLAAASGGRSPV